MRTIQSVMYKFKCPITRRGELTHVSLNGGSFLVPALKSDEFFDWYENQLRSNNKDLFFAEKLLKDISPFKSDLDFTFNVPSILNENQISFIVDNYVNVFNEVFQNIDGIRLYVMEKNKYKSAPKKGLHLCCPDLVMTHTLEYIIRSMFIENTRTFFNEMDLKKSVEDVVDAAVISKNCWLMYRSRKVKDTEPYHVTKIWKINQSGGNISKDDIPIDSDTTKYVRLFSMRNKNSSQCAPIKPKISKEIEDYEKKVLEEQQYKHELTLMKQSECEVVYQVSDDIHYNLAAELVERALSIERANDYGPWLRLGFCLHSIDNRLLKVWDEFSKRVIDKYDPNACYKKWSTMKVKGFQMERLKNWAFEDNPQVYNEIMMSNIENRIINCQTSESVSSSKIAFLDAEVAKLVKFMLKDNIVYTGREWLFFQNHRWHFDTSNNNAHICKCIRNYVVDELKNLNLKKQKDFKDFENEKASSEKDRFVKIVNRLKEQLLTNKYINTIVKECSILFCDQNFLENLDTKNHLLCFNNGVYDLNERVFRPGQPDDYCTLCTKIDYMDYNPENVVYRDIENYLNTVFTDSDLREYMMKLMASFLNGNVTDQKFYFWTGSGSNSKSKFVQLYQNSLGNYSGTLPPTLLTSGQGKANEANSCLASIRGKRFTPMSEPPDGNKSTLQVGLMKQLTGGDRISTREVFKSQIEFTPNVRIVYIANYLPRLTETDYGTFRRILVVGFNSTFLDKEDFKNQPSTFLKNPDLDHQILTWPPYFMSLLIYYYSIYKTEGLTQPESVKQMSREYKQKADTISFFYDFKVEVTKDPNDRVHIKELYEHYMEVLRHFGTQSLKVNAHQLAHTLKNNYKVPFEGSDAETVFKQCKIKSLD